MPASVTYYGFYYILACTTTLTPFTAQAGTKDNVLRHRSPFRTLRKSSNDSDVLRSIKRIKVLPKQRATKHLDIEAFGENFVHRPIERICNDDTLNPQDVSRACGDKLCRCQGHTANCSHLPQGLQYVPRLPSQISNLRLENDHMVAIVRRDFFQNVSHLTFLSLARNRLANVSSLAFRSLVQLRYLILDENPLLGYGGLKEVLQSTPTLLYLTCNRCRLKLLPKGLFDNVKNLETLNLHDNLITDVSTSDFRDLLRLRHLGLSNNSMAFFEVDVISRVENIVLYGNSLSSFPTTCLGSNNSQSLLPCLKSLNMMRNSLSILPERICLPELTFRILGENRFNSFDPYTFSEQRFPKLQSLSLFFMVDLKHISAYAFNNSALLLLALDRNNLQFDNQSMVSYAAFANCAHLANLSTNGNFYTFMAEDQFLRLYDPLRSLQLLHIEDSWLSAITSKMLSIFPHLRYLSLNRNHLSVIPDGTFDGLVHLADLDLSNNQLTTVSSETFGDTLRSRLRRLDLSYNPFTCSCDIVWFRDWLASAPALFQHSYGPYVCRNVPGLDMLRFEVNAQACLLDHATSVFLVAGLATLQALFLCVLLTYRYRWHLRLLLHEAFRGGGIARRRRLRKGGFDYDLFVSYEASDLPWVREQLMPRLEDRLGLRLCIHERDFVVGKFIVDNISDCVEKSKKVMMVFSKGFAHSQWCQFELSMCLRYVMDHDDDLLIVCLDDVTSGDATAAMLAVLRTTTCLQWVARDPDAVRSFWGRLELALQEVVV